MAAAYNRRPGVRQPPQDGDGRGVSESAADLLLLASCAAADRQAEARVERRLRDEALRFVGVASGDVNQAALGSLALLLEDVAADHAAVVVADLAAGTGRPLLAIGNGVGAALLDPVPGPLFEALRGAVRSGRALEAPLLDAAAGASPPVDLLAGAGVRALRWSCRPRPGGRVLVVALHVAGKSTYWTPLRRQFHEGITDVLAAALPADGAGENGL